MVAAVSRQRIVLGPGPEVLLSTQVKSCYDVTILVSGTHLGLATNFPSFFLKLFYTVTDLWMWGALSDGKSRLYFSVLARHRQRPFSHVWVLQNLQVSFIASIFETHPTWRARFLYLFPPGKGSPVLPPGTGTLDKIRVNSILEVQVLHLYPPGARWPRGKPLHWVPLLVSYGWQGYCCGGIRIRLNF
jgi:hypothetical protein